MTLDPPALSLIIPVGPADNAWAGLLETLSVSAVMQRFATDAEIVLASCEPLSLPASMNERLNVRVVITPSGRALQLNAGAAEATGAVLWFVHADTELSESVLQQAWDFAISANLAPCVRYFRLAFAADGPRLTGLNAWGANIRSRWWGLPFGDQTLLLHRVVWSRVGVFNTAMGPGEDLDWVVRARLLGISLACLPGVVRTSARKYRRQGWARTTASHLIATWQMVRAAKVRFIQSRPATRST